MMQRLRTQKMKYEAELMERLKEEECRRHFSMFSQGKSPVKAEMSSENIKGSSLPEELSSPEQSTSKRSNSFTKEGSDVVTSGEKSESEVSVGTSAQVENGTDKSSLCDSGGEKGEKEDGPSSSQSSSEERTPERQREEYRMLRKRTLSPSYYSESVFKHSRRRENLRKFTIILFFPAECVYVCLSFCAVTLYKSKLHYKFIYS